MPKFVDNGLAQPATHSENLKTLMSFMSIPCMRVMFALRITFKVQVVRGYWSQSGSAMMGSRTTATYAWART